MFGRPDLATIPKSQKIDDLIIFGSHILRDQNLTEKRLLTPFLSHFWESEFSFQFPLVHFNEGTGPMSL